MISYSKPDRHHACVHHSDVTGGPDPIDRFTSTKMRSPKPPRSEFPHNFLHAETVQFGYLSPQFSLIDVFVSIQAQDEPFTVLLPLLHLAKEVLPKAGAGTGVIFQFIYQMMAMLLIHRAGVLLFICTGRIIADDPSDYPIISDKSHVSPATQAEVVVAQSLRIELL